MPLVIKMQTVGVSGLSWYNIDKDVNFALYSLQSYHPCVTFLALKTLILRAMQDLGEACGNKGLSLEFRDNNQLSKVQMDM